MKKLIFLLLVAFSVYAQDIDVNWLSGERLPFGNTFWTTDSLDLKVSGMTDSLYNDTLYSNAIRVKYETGIFGVAAYFETVSGTSNSIHLDVRQGRGNNITSRFDDVSGTYTPEYKRKIRWEAWQNVIGAMAHSTDYEIAISQSDSSWWTPTKNFIQFRLREADADTVKHYISPFLW